MIKKNRRVFYLFLSIFIPYYIRQGLISYLLTSFKLFFLLYSTIPFSINCLNFSKNIFSNVYEMMLKIPIFKTPTFSSKVELNK